MLGRVHLVACFWYVVGKYMTQSEKDAIQDSA